MLHDNLQTVQKHVYFHRSHIKTTKQPEWVLIYFLKNSDTEYRCNICAHIINADEKSPLLLEHIQLNHKEVFDLHKDNPFSSVGFRIEFLQVVKTDESDPNDQMNREVIIGEVCEAESEEIAKPITDVTDGSDVLPEIDSHIVVTRNDSNIIVTKKRKSSIKTVSVDNRKRSWVWKYFEKVSSIMYQCRFCSAILSIKGCNTNNLNRHMRTKHTKTFRHEMDGKKDDDLVMLEFDKQESMDKDLDSTYGTNDKGVTVVESPARLRSWVWMYFDPLSATLAQCKLCSRNICHGGNATGNMNRHLKMKHNKTGETDHTWIWKVFDTNEEDFYTCKICQYRCLKMDDLDMSINTILHHLKLEHGVISGDQIITPSSMK